MVRNVVSDLEPGRCVRLALSSIIKLLGGAGILLALARWALRLVDHCRDII